MIDATWRGNGARIDRTRVYLKSVTRKATSRFAMGGNEKTGGNAPKKVSLPTLNLPPDGPEKKR